MKGLISLAKLVEDRVVRNVCKFCLKTGEFYSRTTMENGWDIPQCCGLYSVRLRKHAIFTYTVCVYKVACSMCMRVTLYAYQSRIKYFVQLGGVISTEFPVKLDPVPPKKRTTNKKVRTTFPNKQWRKKTHLPTIILEILGLWSYQCRIRTYKKNPSLQGATRVHRFTYT